MIKIGIIGTGGMAGSHAQRFQSIRGVKLQACCDISAERAEAFAKHYGIPKVYTDYHAMLDQEKLDGVSNVTPDALHAQVALAVLEHGVAILSEKPLASNLEDARKMADAAKKAGVINMVNFSYRNSSALQKAAEVVKKGEIGEIKHVEASYLQSWLVSTGWGDWRTTPGFTWRLSTKHGSAGTLGDVGCHIYDFATLVCGDISEIECRLKTFDKGIPGNKIGEYTLDANDSFVSTVAFANGAIGTVHSTRWACGQLNSLRLRVFGDKGGLEIDLDTSYDEYRICKGKDIESATWKTVKCKHTPNMYERFIRAIRTGVNDPSDFANGAKIQAYLRYSEESDRKHCGVKVDIRY
jgi:predicted dehydrogenase